LPESQGKLVHGSYFIWCFHFIGFVFSLGNKISVAFY